MTTKRKHAQAFGVFRILRGVSTYQTWRVCGGLISKEQMAWQSPWYKRGHFTDHDDVYGSIERYFFIRVGLHEVNNVPQSQLFVELEKP